MHFAQIFSLCVYRDKTRITLSRNKWLSDTTLFFLFLHATSVVCIQSKLIKCYWCKLCATCVFQRKRTYTRRLQKREYCSIGFYSLKHASLHHSKRFISSVSYICKLTPGSAKNTRKLLYPAVHTVIHNYAIEGKFSPWHIYAVFNEEWD